MRRIVLSAAAAAIAVLAALTIATAQQHDTLQQGSTISVTNTFQQVLPKDENRHGCAIQNNGTHTMYVFFGPIANATTSNAFQLAAGQPIYCGNYQTVLTSQISITGTSGDAYVWTVQ